jgi:hypothetical protein
MYVPKCRWGDKIRMDLGEIGLGVVDWIHSGQGPVAGCCECGDETSGSCATELVSYVRTIILPFVLYGCESWSLALREENRLRVFENGFLRRIFGS